MSVNRVTLIGNLGNDPEVRYTPSSKAVCNLSVATNLKYQDRQGQQQEHKCWHRVVVWDRQAEHCQSYLRKGSRVYVEGRLATRSYEDRDGVKRTATEIVARRVLFLSSGRMAAGAEAQAQEQEQEPPERVGAPVDDEQLRAAAGDGIPF